MKWIILSFLLMSCSTFQKKSDLEKINYLIGSGMNKNEIKKLIRSDYKEDEDYISVGNIGLFPQYTIFFDSQNTVQEISCLIPENELQEKLNKIGCNWQLDKDWKSMNNGDHMKKIQSGKCSDKKISFHYLYKSGRYEIRWTK